mmetsp:Transcript_32515/g.95836  ORF Transcript_32515/g.95836 Transcript_32515/m.95836 type:complete len:245 (-) Transcript_32515:24-758(-)
MRCRRETEAEVGNARHDAPLVLVGAKDRDIIDGHTLRTKRGDVLGIFRALILVTGLPADGIDVVVELDKGLVPPGCFQITGVGPSVGLNIIDLHGFERRAGVHGESTGHVRLRPLRIGDGMNVAPLGLHGTLVTNHNGRRVGVEGTGHVDGEQVREGVGVGIERIVPADDVHQGLIGVGEGTVVARQPSVGDVARCRPRVGLGIVHVHLGDHGILRHVPSSDQPKFAAGINGSVAVAGPAKQCQ